MVKSSPGILVRGYGTHSYASHETNEDDDEIESEIVSEAGDIGDRALHSSNKPSNRASPCLSPYRVPGTNKSVALPLNIPQNTLFQPYGLSSPVSPFPKQLDSPVSVEGDKMLNNSKEELPKVLAYSSCLAHLAIFGILGVLTRYSLQKLFGPGAAGVTSNLSILYPDLPSNMVGSFLMGWFGVVFKPSISHASEFLAIGLSTGYLGSLTTFSGWNQKMVELSFQGNWVSSAVCFLLGLFLVAYSIIFGVETAKGFRLLIEKWLTRTKSPSSTRIWRVDSVKGHVAVMMVLLVMLCVVWSVIGLNVREAFGKENGEPQLLLACIVGPFGVWLRWFLARMNGRGLGKVDLVRWIPFGTLIANVSAACLMASLSTVKKTVNTKTCDTIVLGIQLGFLGCLSTVSTFIAEFHAMRESKQPWRAYAYAMITICTSFALGTLIYSIPIWIK